MRSDLIIISKDFRFEASHILPRHPGKCSRLHGHGWEMKVAVIGKVDEGSGFVMDYGKLKDIVEINVVHLLDHSHLGCGVAITQQEVEGDPSDRPSNVWLPPFGRKFYPSSENLVKAIARLLQPIIAEIPRCRLYSVDLKETCTSAARWQAEEYGGLIP